MKIIKSEVRVSNIAGEDITRLSNYEHDLEAMLGTINADEGTVTEIKQTLIEKSLLLTTVFYEVRD